MKAILSVIGKDKVGIIARVSSYLHGINANIEDISQTILSEYFVMIMLVDMTRATLKIGRAAEELDMMGRELGLSVRIQREDIFNSMHKI